MRPKTRFGKITIPKGAIPQPHEIAVAEVLIKTGHSATFIPVCPSTKTPDITFLNLRWEIKSPIGKSSRTLENNIRAALHQSENIIIDLRRIHLAEDKCLNYIRHHIQNFRNLARMFIVVNSNEILEFSRKSTCFSKVRMLK